VPIVDGNEGARHIAPLVLARAKAKSVVARGDAAGERRPVVVAERSIAVIAQDHPNRWRWRLRASTGRGAAPGHHKAPLS
jgi:hypothetical protein